MNKRQKEEEELVEQHRKVGKQDNAPTIRKRASASKKAGRQTLMIERFKDTAATKEESEMIEHRIVATQKKNEAFQQEIEATQRKSKSSERNWRIVSQCHTEDITCSLNG